MHAISRGSCQIYQTMYASGAYLYVLSASVRVNIMGNKQKTRKNALKRGMRETEPDQSLTKT